MDSLLTKRASELAKELAGQAATLDDLNGMMRSLMKTAIETMLNSEMSVHLGRGRAASDAEAGPHQKAVIETKSAAPRAEPRSTPAPVHPTPKTTSPTPDSHPTPTPDIIPLRTCCVPLWFSFAS